MHVQAGEDSGGDAVLASDLIGRHAAAQDQAIVRPGRGVVHPFGEVTAGITGHLARGDELRIIVARIELEGLTLVVLDDASEIVAKLGLGLGHAALSVIVAGDRQRPATQAIVGLGEIARSPIGRHDRVHAIIYGTVHVHETAAGGRHELPDPAGPDRRHGVGLERGLHVGQVGQVLGQPVLAHDFAEGLVVASADLHPATEFLPHAALAADPIGRAIEGTDTTHPFEFGEQLLVCFAQWLVGDDPVLQGPDPVLVVLEARADEGPIRLPEGFAIGTRQVGHLVDDTHMLVVMEGHLVTAPDTVDVAPEIDVRRDLLRHREGTRTRIARSRPVRIQVSLALIPAAATAAQRQDRKQGNASHDDRRLQASRLITARLITSMCRRIAVT